MGLMCYFLLQRYEEMSRGGGIIIQDFQYVAHILRMSCER